RGCRGDATHGLEEPDGGLEARAADRVRGRAGALRSLHRKGKGMSGTTDELCELDLVEVAEAIRTRKVSAVEVTGACIQRIERLQPTLNCFISIEAEEALKAAERADEEAARGVVRGPLHGVPLAHKDMLYRA